MSHSRPLPAVPRSHSPSHACGHGRDAGSGAGAGAGAGANTDADREPRLRPRSRRRRHRSYSEGDVYTARRRAVQSRRARLFNQSKAREHKMKVLFAGLRLAIASAICSSTFSPLCRRVLCNKVEAVHTVLGVARDARKQRDWLLRRAGREWRQRRADRRGHGDGGGSGDGDKAAFRHAPSSRHPLATECTATILAGSV